MKRGKLPRRKKYLPRSSKRIRSRKADPTKRRFAKRRCQPYLDWLKEQPCCITGKRTGAHDGFIGEHDFPMWVRINVEPAHVRARGAGGDDLYNAVPLTWRLHAAQHQIGINTFQEKYSVDLQAIAREHTERFLELYPEHRSPAAAEI